MSRHILTTCLLLLLGTLAGTITAQDWVAQTYSIQTETDIEYGTATDFAGTERTLLMDISVPTNDSPPACGRPLMVIVHGGAWITGNKSEAYPTHHPARLRGAGLRYRFRKLPPGAIQYQPIHQLQYRSLELLQHDR